MNTIEARLARLKTRIDNSPSKRTGHLVERLARHFDPAAIAVLIQLLDHADARAEYATLALLRFGEVAHAPLLACLRSRDTNPVTRVFVQDALQRLEYRMRFERVVGRSFH